MSFKCFAARRWISLKVDREPLPGSASAYLEEHLASCRSCRRALAEETKRSRLLGSILQEPSLLPASLSAAILQKARRGEDLTPLVSFGERWRAGLWRRASWTAAALVLVSSSWLVLRTHSDLVSMRGSPADGTSPFKIFLEEDRLQSDVVPAVDGSPLQRERLTRRRTLLNQPKSKLDVQRMDLRYLKLTSYPYQ